MDCPVRVELSGSVWCDVAGVCRTLGGQQCESESERSAIDECRLVWLFICSPKCHFVCLLVSVCIYGHTPPGLRGDECAGERPPVQVPR